MDKRHYERIATWPDGLVSGKLETAVILARLRPRGIIPSASVFRFPVPH
jgi:hypothetical protein